MDLHPADLSAAMVASREKAESFIWPHRIPAAAILHVDTYTIPEHGSHTIVAYVVDDEPHFICSIPNCAAI